jgi:hypothetical protein
MEPTWSELEVFLEDLALHVFYRKNDSTDAVDGGRLEQRLCFDIDDNA